jgi:hypothetical protein
MDLENVRFTPVAGAAFEFTTARALIATSRELSKADLILSHIYGPSQLFVHFK